MNNEMCWLVLPIVGLLSQLGGTFWKGYKRFIIPIVAVATAWMFIGHFYYGFIPMMLHLWLGFTLPITLKGNSIPEYTINKLWIPLWAIFLCSSALWLNTIYWLVAVICGLLLAILVFLSNMPKTAKYFQWKGVELFEGIFSLIPLMYVITLQP